MNEWFVDCNWRLSPVTLLKFSIKLCLIETWDDVHSLTYYQLTFQDVCALKLN